MPWLESFAEMPDGMSPRILAFRLVLAFILGLLVAAIYRRTNGGEAVPSFRATLVLLTILIAAVTQVIGDNVARAFSLVGALSIVRFRTVVQDTRDTAFVIFAVTLGMAVGAGNMWVAALALVVVGTAAAVMGTRAAVAEEGASFRLVVCAALGSAPELLAPVFANYLEHWKVAGVATANRGASIETDYAVRLRPGTDPASLVQALNDVEGVQSVQLRGAAN